jgi:hypothetical protein
MFLKRRECMFLNRKERIYALKGTHVQEDGEI